METTVLKVNGMSCEHCVKAVKKAVTALPGIGSVEVDLKAGMVTVEYDTAQTSLDKIKAEIDDQGYDIIA